MSSIWKKILVFLLWCVPFTYFFIGVPTLSATITNRPATGATSTTGTPLIDEQTVGITSFTPQHYGGQKQNWSIVQDNRGIIFIANSGGVLEYDSLNWRLIPVSGGSTFALDKDERGRIYVGGTGQFGYLAADKNGLLHYNSLIYRLPQQYQHIQDRVVQIRAIPGGVVALFERLMVVLTPTSIETYNAQDHFFSFIYRAGSLYVIDSIQGLLLAEGGKLKPITGGKLLRAYVMLPYGDHDILIVTTQQPLIFDRQAPETPFRPFLTVQSDYFTDNIVTCGVLLRSGDIMLGSLEKSIAIFPPTGGKPVFVGLDQGLPDSIVYGLFQDAASNTWVGMDKGISLLRSPLFNTHVKKPGAAKGERAGSIPFAALIRGCNRFADDSVIFQGAFYDTQYHAQEMEQQPHQIHSFPYAYNGFRFSFCSNSFEEAGKILYQCKMDGQDPEWSNWDERTVREYTNLVWGPQIFRVRAKNAFGEISQEATFSFIIMPPWYETWWFLVSQITFMFLLLIVSRLMSRVGHAPKISEYMIIFVVIIIFEYFNGFISPFIGRYSDGIPFFEMLMTATLSIVISPAEDFILGLMEKLIKGKK